MFRRVLWFLPIGLLAAHAFLGFGPMEYQAGYDQAIRDLEETRQKMGWASEMGGAIMDGIEHLPPNPEESERWNEGYRQAVQDQWEGRLR